MIICLTLAALALARKSVPALAKSKRPTAKS